jgi:teichoic acid transport system ATP-binding protein
VSSVSVSDSVETPVTSDSSDPVIDSTPEESAPATTSAILTERTPTEEELDRDLAIRVKNVKVDYRTIVNPRANTLRHTLTNLGRKSNDRKVRYIHAVRGVSFDVEHGQVLGIIGANGAGKSTMMRAMAGILPPSSGEIVVNGRISVLLALGVGFNGQLSGRDNVILGSMAAGLTRKQVMDRFDQIVQWAELEDVIDLPMKAYSSGMYGRLAFAVSTHLDPDVLLVDEALSTGDAHFRRKSYEKMQEIVGQARTIVIVSHGIGAIKEMCDTVIWMHKGEIVKQGDPDQVAAEYLEFQGVPQEKTKAADETADDDDQSQMDDSMQMEDF